jgi:hypothetical protein
MSYLFQPGGQDPGILDPEARFILGYVDLPEGGYRVRSPDGDTIAVVKSIDDALPLLITTRKIRRSGFRTVRLNIPN